MANTCTIASLALASRSVNSASFSDGIWTPILVAVRCSTSRVTEDCSEAGGSVREVDIEVTRERLERQPA